MIDIGYVNAPRISCRNPDVVAINSAVQMDLTGQISADLLVALEANWALGRVQGCQKVVSLLLHSCQELRMGRVRLSLSLMTGLVLLLPERMCSEW